jgi:hypothetical protein
VVTSFLTDLLRSTPGLAVAIVVVLGLLLLVLIGLLNRVLFAETETPSRRLRSIIRELRALRR